MIDETIEEAAPVVEVCPIDPAELERERAHALELDDEIGPAWTEEDENYELDDDEIDEGVIS